MLYGGVAMAYDAEHHLTRMGDAQTPTFTAGYGPDGLRAWSEAGGVRTRYLYAGEQRFQPSRCIHKSVTQQNQPIVTVSHHISL